MKKYSSLLILVLLVFSCKKSEEESAVKSNDLITITKTQFEGSGMQLGIVSEQLFDDAVQTSGLIDVPAQHKAKITALLGGYVKNTPLMVGDKVQKGQLLVTLENTEYVDLQQSYLEVYEQMAFLQSEYQRQKTMLEENITSQKNYLKAESDYKKNKATYESLKQKLQLLNINPKQVEKGNIVSTVNIYAPITGEVTVLNANVGKFIAPSDTFIELVDLNYLYLQLNVFEKDVLKIQTGQKISYKIPEANADLRQSTVQLIGKSIESANRTISVSGQLSENDKKQLIAGMFVEAQIIIGSKKALALPTDALVNEDKKDYIFILEKQDATQYYFKRIPVQKGTANETWVEVGSKYDLKNKQIVIKGAFNLN